MTDLESFQEEYSAQVAILKELLEKNSPPQMLVNSTIDIFVDLLLTLKR